MRKKVPELLERCYNPSGKDRRFSASIALHPKP